jgi:hypothetical protein
MRTKNRANTNQVAAKKADGIKRKLKLKSWHFYSAKQVIENN